MPKILKRVGVCLIIFIMKKILIIGLALISMAFKPEPNQSNDFVYVFNFENYGSKRIEIYPIDGKPSWTLEYTEQWYDDFLKCEVYSNEYAIVYVYDNSVVYEDNDGSYEFKIIPCQDNESNTIKLK